jgi:hypothetical protein
MMQTMASTRDVSATRLLMLPPSGLPYQYLQLSSKRHALSLYSPSI